MSTPVLTRLMTGWKGRYKVELLPGAAGTTAAAGETAASETAAAAGGGAKQQTVLVRPKNVVLPAGAEVRRRLCAVPFFRQTCSFPC